MTRHNLRIGLIRLTDAAPVVVAQELGYFADQGIDVDLSVEPSWSNLADKLAFGRLDASFMLPPLAFATSLGLRGVEKRLLVPMTLSRNGNLIAVTNAVAAALEGAADPLDLGRRFGAVLARRPRRLRFAVVHAYSSHHLLIRTWLAAAGIDPDKDLELCVVPPADMVAAMRDGQIEGFCAGAPWGVIAAREGIGRIIMTSAGIWRNHPEKCFTVTEEWAASHGEALHGVLRALLRAAQFCDLPENAPGVAALMAEDAYLGVAPDAIRQSLPGGNPGAMVPTDADCYAFFSHDATFPWRAHAAWFLRQMVRWGYLTPERADQAESLYRPDLWRRAAEAEGLAVPASDAGPAFSAVPGIE